MTHVLKIIRNAALYAVLITALFLLFAAVTGYETPAITAGRYFLILAFSAVLSVSELLFSAKNMAYIVKIVLHFAISLTAFLVLFLFIGGMIPRGATTIFAITLLFTAIYFFLLALLLLARRAFKRAHAHDTSEKDVPASDYTPRFGE